MTSSIFTSQLSSFFLWSFVPPLASRVLLSLSYAFLPTLRPTHPPHPTPQQFSTFQTRTHRHAVLTRTLLVSAYLVYTVASVYSLQSNPSNVSHFTLLGLPSSTLAQSPDASQLVKSHWRRLARLHHPDKVGSAGEAYFVRLRNAVDEIEDEGTRWAYERFGPGVGEWKADSTRSLLVLGARSAAGWYVFAAGGVALLSLLRKDERENSFWRLTLLVLTLTLECALIMHPAPSALLILPRRTTFEHIALLHQLFLSLSSALSQLLPLLAPLPPPPEPSPTVRALTDAEHLWPFIERLTQLRTIAENEVNTIVGLELRPLLPDARTRDEAASARVEGIKRSMRDTFLDLRVKSTNEGREAWGSAVQEGVERARRRRPSPSGKGLVEGPGRLPSPPPE